MKRALSCMFVAGLMALMIGVVGPGAAGAAAIDQPPAPMDEPVPPVDEPPAPVDEPPLVDLVPAPADVAPAPVVNKPSPAITITSPTGTVYRPGRRLLVKYACASRAGVARCTATFGPVGGRMSKVASGQKVVPSKIGRYVLTITATDRTGSTASRSAYLRATGDKAAPRIDVVSPWPITYPPGRLLLLKFSCSDASGVARCSATLAPVGLTPRPASNDTPMWLPDKTRYVLRITATDRVGNTGAKTVYFSIR